MPGQARKSRIPRVENRWHAGELGCARLAFELRVRVNRLAPGETLEVVAHDAGAPVDIPAWCRTTGHTLVEAKHPTYVIRRKPD